MHGAHDHDKSVELVTSMLEKKKKKNKKTTHTHIYIYGHNTKLYLNLI